MTDEMHEFFQDCADKASTAKSAKSKRTHCGKGGAVRFPSDNLTKKEREAMNSECKTYRMNDPVSWGEFKTWPKEHQINYIKLLRKKYGVPDKCIGEMMGVTKSAFSNLVTSLGIGVGKKHNSWKVWDKEGFYTWCGGVKEDAIKHVEAVEAVEEKTIKIPEIPETDPIEEAKRTIYKMGKEYENGTPINTPFIIDTIQTGTMKELVEEFANDSDTELAKPYMPHGGDYEIPPLMINAKTVVPDYGNMSFRGNVDDILRTVSNLLNGELVRLEVKWEVLD